MMKNLLWLPALLTIGFAAGCTRSAENPATDTRTIATPALDRAAAASQLPNDLAAEKAEYVAKMQTELAGLNRGLDEMAAKLEHAGDAVKTEAAPQLAALREQAAQLNKQLAAVADATPSTWSGIKADSEKAYTSLKDGVARARQWASEKIAP